MGKERTGLLLVYIKACTAHHLPFTAGWCEVPLKGVLSESNRALLETTLSRTEALTADWTSCQSQANDGRLSASSPWRRSDGRGCSPGTNLVWEGAPVVGSSSGCRRTGRLHHTAITAIMEFDSAQAFVPCMYTRASIRPAGASIQLCEQLSETSVLPLHNRLA